MKKIFKILAISLGLVMVLGACGNSENDSKESGAGSSSASGEITVISREEGSGTRSAFVELVGIQDEDKNDLTSEEAFIQNNTEAVMTAISGDKNAIGYISLGSLKDSVKALKIDGVEVSSENVANGSYKIARPFNIVTNDDTNEVVNDFINYILSKDGQNIVEEEGYIKSESEEKEYTPADVEGNITIAGSSSVTPVMEKLVEAYGKVNSNVKIQVNLSDSTTGIQSVNDGVAQIGMVSRELKDSEENLNKTTIALDGIAVVINKENPIEDVKLESIKDIYTEKIMDWKDVK
ncbi:substrate-binding domain-containing protein [Miniphocaeibacter halophilus]|uniref:Substrate-binding domain-containing protein n=1 Tax=Miniphocaeibacter halophilus TaxID=2931922 RepID=A0AC61MT63_9FIRM|nr:substrate-binding domain-containing protein [Miniphocaeibacter halophilus]QQK08548.1 substrate-binding domain-containing protein [Miniphocaeibacter halophilus]